MVKSRYLIFLVSVVAFALLAPNSSQAATFNANIVEFTGAAGDGDLSNAANWSGPLTADSTASISANSVIPDTGLKLTGTMTAGFLKVYQASQKNLFIDLSGGTFNVPDIRVSDDTSRKGSVILSGGANSLTNIRVEAAISLILTNGVYRITSGNFYCYNWDARLVVAKGAELAVDKISGNRTSGTNSGRTGVVVDGGKISINGYTSDSWGIIKYGHDHGLNYIDIINGGEYYEAVTPQFEVNGKNSNFLLRDASYISTNATGASRNMMIAMKNSKFAVTNSTLKASQIYCGKLYRSDKGWYYSFNQEATNTVFTFHNSLVELAFPAAPGYAACAGLYFASNATRNVVLLDGPNNVFKTVNLMIAGKTNSFEIADGTLEVTKYLYTGTKYACGGIGNTVKFSGGTSTINQIVTECGTNSTIEVCGDAVFNVTGKIWMDSPGGLLKFSGGISKVKEIQTDGAIDSTIEVTGSASVDVAENILLKSPGLALKVSGGKLALDAIDFVEFNSPNTSYEITGGIVTSRVSFASSDCKVFIGNGATNVATYGGSQVSASPIVFAEGMSNNVVVISNGTFNSHMGFSQRLLETTDGPKQEGIPFTNCPNCRIEFQGESPKLLITSSSRYTGEKPWYAAAFGCSYFPGKLKDVLRIRYVLPENGYAEAPIQVATSRSVWGGNAEFEFDISDFKWPQDKPMLIPLVYDDGAFKGWRLTLYIDVAGLNETNAERMPVCPSSPNIKARFVLSEDGKTLCAYVPCSGGTVLLIR